MGSNSEQAGLATAEPRPETEEISITLETSVDADGETVAALAAEVERLEEELAHTRSELDRARTELSRVETELELTVSRYERQLAAREDAHEERAGDRGPPPGKHAGVTGTVRAAVDSLTVR